MKYSYKVAALCVSAAFATGFAFADGDIPTVTEVSMQQGPDNRIVTIKYKLDSYPAVVTLDVKTNDTVSIGGEHIWNAEGAVWRKVTSEDADGSGWCTITWDPTQSWKDGNGNGFKAQDVKAEVTAWPLHNTPDYMVVDLTATGGTDTQKYYPAVDYLPGSLPGQTGAITNNPVYKTSTIVMRKIMAKDVTWTMGATSAETASKVASYSETPHQVKLSNNYYIGVFEVTQGQWIQVKGSFPSTVNFTNHDDRVMRPMEGVSYNTIRGASGIDSASFLYALRNKTGIDFDLPGEAQWEFAARAGNGDTKWGNGTGIQNADIDTNLNLFGRYKMNGGYVDGTSSPSYDCTADNGTAVVGTYASNNWGLYDVGGNVNEWCLDWAKSNITDINGAVCDDSASGRRMKRGGCWVDVAAKCRPAYRSETGTPTYPDVKTGFRVVCTAGLQ